MYSLSFDMDKKFLLAAAGNKGYLCDNLFKKFYFAHYVSLFIKNFAKVCCRSFISFIITANIFKSFFFIFLFF